jgi:hypothetical protein
MKNLRFWARLSLGFTLPALACFACSSSDNHEEGAETPDTVRGALVGSTAPASGKVAIIWSVSSGSPDYAYVFGEGTSTGTRYIVTPEGPPPEEALNRYGVGIGVLALFPKDTELPEGKLDEDAMPEPLGISQDHAIIWRAADATGPEWSSSFPAGYSCGVCVRVPDSGDGVFHGFDSFEPEDCSKVDIAVGSSGDACNWT